MKTLLAIAAAAFLTLAPVAAQAGEDVDMGKITCKELLSSPKDQIAMMLMWIDGYMSAQSENTVMSDAWMNKLSTYLGDTCSKNPGQTIMKAIENMPAE